MLKYEDIPPLLRQAILAAEDAEFESHFGLRPVRLLVTVVRNLVYRRRLLYSGASTLTQQLARKLFLKPEKTLERKVKEVVLTLQIERRYTKHEIFTLYCNQMNLGHGAYGVEAASRVYFGKPIKNLKLEEAATIAGILQLPERQSPYVNQKWATQRRNYTLQRMADEGFITQAQADAAKAKPIVLAGLPGPTNTSRRTSSKKSASTSSASTAPASSTRPGWRSRRRSTPTCRRRRPRPWTRACARSTSAGAIRKPAKNVGRRRHVARRIQRARDGTGPFAPGDIVPAVVMEVARRHGAPARSAGLSTGVARTARRAFRLTDAAGFQWTGTRRPAREGRRHRRGGGHGRRRGGRRRSVLTLEQTPLVEGALMAIDNRTGQIRAMVGGFDFARSKFNRAVQAPRQVGSAFKPFVFTAAIDRGYTPTSIIVDAPVSCNAGPGQPPYAPQNYDRKYEGTITLRRVLEQSRNIPTVKLMEQLTPAQVDQLRAPARHRVSAAAVPLDRARARRRPRCWK